MAEGIAGMSEEIFSPNRIHLSRDVRAAGCGDGVIQGPTTSDVVSIHVEPKRSARKRQWVAMAVIIGNRVPEKLVRGVVGQRVGRQGNLGFSVPTRGDVNRNLTVSGKSGGIGT